MISKIKNWWTKHDMQLTWFIIGTFTTWLIVDLSIQHYQQALVDAVILVLNYIARPKV